MEIIGVQEDGHENPSRVLVCVYAHVLTAKLPRISADSATLCRLWNNDSPYLPVE